MNLQTNEFIFPSRVVHVGEDQPVLPAFPLLQPPQTYRPSPPSSPLFLVPTCDRQSLHRSSEIASLPPPANANSPRSASQ